VSPGPVDPRCYVQQTALTQDEPAVIDWVRSHLIQGVQTPADLLQLAHAIVSAVRYEAGHTETQTTAAQALALGRGVCQDHAHLFIACCRHLGLPARYVSGYVHAGAIGSAASHAWVDVWLPVDGTARDAAKDAQTQEGRWVSIDITNQQWQSDLHCRLAVGRDYLDCAPVRGTRLGGGHETLETQVEVEVLSA
jgi:transglutaminase-like putative cysteine protease